ncbi:GNAT family N-acetyltransferase [Spirosoma sp. SC4-14]|uniref:GNAT family N-acetyltransferase n=1 Tax=Spirosoma sp. SC4-14 TaxID=3128900 RepID=UPI0030D4EAAF
MKLVELTVAENYGYGAFMQKGFVAHPDCFRISPADHRYESFPTTGQPDSFTLGALTDQGELAGSVSFRREGQNRERLRHKGLLFAMYVAADYGGQGIGRRLIEEVIGRARSLPHLEQIVLTVIATNHVAKRLYESIGFCSFSLEPRAIKDGNTYYDEEQMVLFLDRNLNAAFS